MSKKLRLRGVITALVTPFSSTGEIEQESLEEIVRFQIENRVNGLFPLGTTGMGPVMEPEERKRVAEIVVGTANGRISVIVQIGDADPNVSVELARHAERVGADAVAALTPFYYHPDSSSIVEHYRRLTKETSLPVLVYNIPRNTGLNVDARLLRQLSEIPGLVGIKDSSRDFSQLLDYLAAVPDDFNVINGTDSYLFSAFCAGVHAGVSATANAVPELFVEMYEAYKSGDLEKGQELQKRIHAVRALLSDPPLAPILEALKIRGLRSGNVRPPLRSMTAAEIGELRAGFSRLMPELRV